MTGKLEDRFKQAVIVTLAKRAANRCSNPNCGAITSGPSEAAGASVNVGEAAHIFGAHKGSARFDETMSSVARSDIANAVWLCGNCHKLIDDDEQRYPAGLLFEWVRQHEEAVALVIGKAGAEARQRYEQRHLEEFGKLSYRAERIIIDKPTAWEYRLTEELLRFEMMPVLRRWGAFKRELYARQMQHLSYENFLPWIMIRQTEVLHMAKAFEQLLNVEFARAWGAPGEPGDEQDIVATCRLYVEMCVVALAWEETLKFAKVEEPFVAILELYRGVAGSLIDEAAKLPQWLSETFCEENPTGEKRLSLTISLPEGWADAVEAAFYEATRLL